MLHKIAAWLLHSGSHNKWNRSTVWLPILFKLPLCRKQIYGAKKLFVVALVPTLGQPGTVVGCFSRWGLGRVIQLLLSLTV